MSTTRSRVALAFADTVLASLALVVSLTAPVGVCAADTAPRPAGVAQPLPAKPAQVLPWIEDDYSRAVAEAKARKVPIFVESWAPW
jgi:hypothetical protein